jgi:hypothetical protein
MKLICIKEEDIEERDDTKPLVLGKIYDGHLMDYVNGNAWKIKLPNNIFLPYAQYKIYSLNNFMSLAECRENRINKILDDDYS